MSRQSLFETRYIFFKIAKISGNVAHMQRQLNMTLFYNTGSLQTKQHEIIFGRYMSRISVLKR